MPLIRNFIEDEAAATSVEYAMIAVSIAVAIIAAVTVLGGNVNAMYISVSAAF